MKTNLFEVPLFSPPPASAVFYTWWSWHPCYPYWSQSCWKAATIEKAQERLADPKCGLDRYHNKLIKHDGATLEEVQDVPCDQEKYWSHIKL